MNKKNYPKIDERYPYFNVPINLLFDKDFLALTSSQKLVMLYLIFWWQTHEKKTTAYFTMPTEYLCSMTQLGKTSIGLIISILKKKFIFTIIRYIPHLHISLPSTMKLNLDKFFLRNDLT